jgi:phosphoribosylformylglycinamidine synthase
LDLKRPDSPVILVRCSPFTEGLEAAARMHRQVAEWIRHGRILAAHDVSDGGLLVALAEMAIAGGFGLHIQRRDDLVQSARDWFTPWAGCYVLEAAGDAAAIVTPAGSQVYSLGRVVGEESIRITDGDRVAAEWSLDELTRAWRGPWADLGLEPRPGGSR